VLAAALGGVMFATRAAHGQQDDILNDVLKDAQPASRPAPATAPVDLAATEPGDLPTAPKRARAAVLALSSGKTIKGPVWTTLATPLRVYQDASKTYKDVDLDLVARLDVVVDEAVMEDDWRWLKEGSDQKIYSGKKYPNVTLHYRLTLQNGQVVEGPVVAPMFVLDGAKLLNLALYKKKKGELGQTLQDIVYIKSAVLGAPAASPGAAATPGAPAATTHLPLLPD
jgi:hypothetical protein